LARVHFVRPSYPPRKQIYRGTRVTDRDCAQRPQKSVSPTRSLRALRRSSFGARHRAVNGALPIVLPHMRARRPPSFVMSTKLHVSSSTANGSVSTFIG